MEATDFNIDTALEAALALNQVLAARRHRRKVLGQDVLVPGQLGDALHLPRIVRRLQSKQSRQRELGLEDFQALWPTLSAGTRDKVLDGLGWYDPKDLDWDDKRSNRRPVPGQDD
ncbi:hypothetical protein [Marinobacter xestospongiae]|uniref:Uncharacterized protein n=1 Tax=Marinobacter xestospongiae TaxID=994319 RepID=A0ABU3VT93_9GAMM|nr:hypothetical protein [Marinobacter xestospongiae]MDV2077485.1 hypothetical protein [Marinobacter xestospongiae]